jgi:sec-independent protein translocase protein TatA
MFHDLLVAPLAWTIGMTELIWIAIIFVLLFGSARLPSLMRNMGRSINEFKAGMQDKPAAGKIEGGEEE